MDLTPSSKHCGQVEHRSSDTECLNEIKLQSEATSFDIAIGLLY